MQLTGNLDTHSYNASPVFRSNIYRQTVYWTLAGLFFVGVTAGVVWGSP